MKLYNQYNLLLFFQKEVERDFETIKKIVSAIDSDMHPDLMRDFVNRTLREMGMPEEGLCSNSSAQESQPVERTPDIVWYDGTKEFLLVFDEFPLHIGDRIYHMTVYLN